MKITATIHRLKIAFKLSGKRYGQSNDVQAPGTLFPFDEIDLEIGESWVKPPGAELVFVREYLPTQPEGNIYKGA
jgi:hypothetical protein